MGVKTKPFSKTYRLPTAQGYTIFNGDQITRIEGKRVPEQEDSWEITFYLSDGYTLRLPANDWTRNFAHDLFDLDKPNE